MAVANTESDGLNSLSKSEHISDAKAKKSTLRQLIPGTGEWANISAVDNGDGTYSLKTTASLSGGGGDGAILDGVSSSIKASVLDYTNSNPLAVRLTNTDGDYIAAGAGTQYTEGDTDASITGTAILWEDGSDTLRAVSAAKPLPVDLQDASVAVTGTFWQATQPVSAASLPLPTGASTSAKQDTIIGHVDGIEGLLGTIDTDTGNIATSVSNIDTDTSDLLLEMRIMNGAMAMRVDDTTGTLYQGWAEPGTATSAASWRIRKVVTSGTPEDTTITFADGDRSFNNIWDDRASLTYS